MKYWVTKGELGKGKTLPNKNLIELTRGEYILATVLVRAGIANTLADMSIVLDKIRQAGN